MSNQEESAWFLPVDDGLIVCDQVGVLCYQWYFVIITVSVHRHRSTIDNHRSIFGIIVNNDVERLS